MTPKQEKLIEAYIRSKVKSVIVESRRDPGELIKRLNDISGLVTKIKPEVLEYGTRSSDDFDKLLKAFKSVIFSIEYYYQHGD